MSGTAAAVGTGAFSNATVQRDVTVEVTNDIEGYLRLDPLESDGRSIIDGDKIEFEIPGPSEETQGEGVAPDSEYYFDSLVEVGNQGSNAIVVFAESGGDLNEIAIYDSNDPDRELLTDEDHGVELDTGNDFQVGIYINTFGVETGKKKGTLTFTGLATDS